MDAYKYYTKEQYEEFGSMLETAQQIDERLKNNKIESYNNKILMKSYKNAWKERTFQTKQFKKYWHHPSKDGAILRYEPEFLDD
jgi:hypothetical protein